MVQYFISVKTALDWPWLTWLIIVSREGASAHDIVFWPWISIYDAIQFDLINGLARNDLYGYSLSNARFKLLVTCKDLKWPTIWILVILNMTLAA